MSEIIDIILSNKLYIVFLVCIAAALVFFIIKKLLKLLMYAAIILVVFLAYIYFTGRTIDSAVQPVEKALQKAQKIVR